MMMMMTMIQILSFQHPSMRVKKFILDWILDSTLRHYRTLKLLTVRKHNFGMKISGELWHKSLDWMARSLVSDCFPKERNANIPYWTTCAGARRPDTALRRSMESRLPQLARAIDPRCVLCDEQGGNCVRISLDYSAQFLHLLVVMELQPIRRFRACFDKFG